MFKFLKDKLKKAVSSFTEKVNEEAETIVDKSTESSDSKKSQTIVDKSTKSSETRVEKPVKEKPVVKKKDIVPKSEKKKDAQPVKKEEKKKESKKSPSQPKVKKTTESKPSVEKPSVEKPSVEKPSVEKPSVEKPSVEKSVEKVIEESEEPKKKKGFLGGLFSKKKDEVVVKEIIDEPVQEEVTPEVKEPVKKSIFSHISDSITKKKLSESQFEDIFFDLELLLLENNTALEVIEKIKADLKIELVDNPIDRSQVEQIIHKTLKKSIQEVLNVPTVNILDKISEKKPYIISFVGVNGAGKTTHLAKLVQHLKDNNLTCVIAACDTFRAAAIQQLEEHANKLETKMIKHEYGSDAAAVAFDAVAHAKAKGLDVVLIDTAGRLHSNTNLMDELRKINKVVNPDFTLFVGESITGNDCVEQAVQFNDAVGIDGIILSKADIDEKGGAAISISYVTSKPILFLGVGQKYSDLQVFDPKVVLESLGLE